MIINRVTDSYIEFNNGSKITFGHHQECCECNQAEADLEVQKINADAAEYTGLKESAKNKAISESLTPDLIKYYQIQQWNGQYPNYYAGSDNVSTIVGGIQ